MKTFLLFAIGFLLFDCAFTGRLGSVLAVFIDPTSLTEFSSSPPGNF